MNKALLLFVVIFTSLVFFPSLDSEFIRLDDTSHLIRNPHTILNNYYSIITIFKTQVNHTYIPLTILSFAIERYFFDLNPFIYHLNNLILHLCVVSLIYVLALRLGLGSLAAMVAAMVFAIHPMHVESVVWVTERKDVLYSFFYLLSLLVYLKYIQTNHKKWYFLALVFSLLSILSKAMALSLPLIIILLDLFLRRKKNLALFLEKIPFFLVIVPITFITYSNHVRMPFDSLKTAVLMASWTSTFYIKKFFFPDSFSPLYEIPKPIDISQPDYLLSVFLVIILVSIIIVCRSQRWIIFACVYYILSMFFLIRYDDVGDVNIVADRFMYLPSLGFCLMLGFYIEKIHKQLHSFGRNIFLISIIVFFTLLGSKATIQSQMWKNNFLFWNSITKSLPNSSIGYMQRSLEYKKLGRQDLALNDLKYVLSIDPLFSRAWNNLGVLYLERGDVNLALEAFNKAIDSDLKFSEFYINRGNLYAKLQNTVAALTDFDQAVFLRQDLATGYFHRANFYFDQNDFELAISDYSEAIKKSPNSAKAFYNRAVSYDYQKQWSKALIDAQKASNLGYVGAELYVIELKEKLNKMK